MTLLLIAISVIGGFLSGLLGVGGAIVLIPLLLTVPPLLGFPEFGMPEATGISIVQVLASSAAGCLAHSKSGNVDRRASLLLGLPLGVGSLIGGWSSGVMRGIHMEMVFAGIVLLSLILLVRKKDEAESEADAPQTMPTLNAPLAIVIGAMVGVAAGIVGAGGGFVLIPIMIAVLNIPVRIAVGSSLGIVLIGAIMGTIGKAMGNQLTLAYAIPVAIGSIPASRLGAKVSKTLAARSLKRLLIALILVTLIKTIWSISGHWLK